MDNKSKLKAILQIEHPELTQDFMLEELALYCSRSIKLSGSLFELLANFLFLVIDLFSLIFHRKSFIHIDFHQQSVAWNRFRSLPGFSQFDDFLRTLSLLRLVEISGNKYEKY
jgi:hypothetical protein